MFNFRGTFGGSDRGGNGIGSSNDPAAFLLRALPRGASGSNLA